MFFLFRTEYLFEFDDKFEIHDDMEVLKRMGLVMGMYVTSFFICSDNVF